MNDATNTPLYMNVKKLPRSVASAADIPTAMNDAAVNFTPIACINWASEYPYCPEAMFRIAHTGDTLLLHYRVTEECVRAVCEADDERVWTDSCVEFFFSPNAQDGSYYNLECNCCGTLLLGGGGLRPNRQRAEADIRAQIDRWASLGRNSFGTKQGRCTWEVALKVPATAFFLHTIRSFDGQEAKANFYKCGDELPIPHFLSWQPIDTPHPDFHHPEYFGTLHFEA